MSSRNFIVAGILASALLVGALFIYTNSQTSEAATLAPNTKIRINLDTSFSLNVRRTPAGTKIGEQPNGKEGTKVGEPQQANGRLWQQVNFDQDPDGLPAQAGWVAASLIVSISSLIPTPTPVAVDCAQGTLPRLNYTGDAVWGKDWVPIGDGEVHTYCFQLRTFSRKLIMRVGDRTGAEQCTWNTTEFIPPQGSSLKTEVGTGRGAGYSFYDPAGLPQGIWRIRITEAVTPNCNDKYAVLVHP